jgi:hypothetical protein
MSFFIVVFFSDQQLMAGIGIMSNDGDKIGREGKNNLLPTTAGPAFLGSDLFSYLIGMEVEFRTTIVDYLAFYKYFYFRRKIGLRILIVALVCLMVANGSEKGHSVFTWTNLLTVLVVAVVIIVIGSVIPYIRASRKARKTLAVPGQLDQKRIVLSADGITVKNEDEAGTVVASGSWRGVFGAKTAARCGGFRAKAGARRKF